MRRRSAVEPVIGHLKDEHRMGRNYLAHRSGDFNNAVLAAVGYNFRRIIRWLRILCSLFLMAFLPQSKPVPEGNGDSSPPTNQVRNGPSVGVALRRSPWGLAAPAA